MTHQILSTKCSPRLAHVVLHCASCAQMFLLMLASCICINFTFSSLHLKFGHHCFLAQSICHSNVRRVHRPSFLRVQLPTQFHFRCRCCTHQSLTVFNAICSVTFAVALFIKLVELATASSSSPTSSDQRSPIMFRSILHCDTGIIRLLPADIVQVQLPYRAVGAMSASNNFKRTVRG